MIVIPALDNLEKYTLPCIRSIHHHEPDYPIVVVDGGSDPVYPQIMGARLITAEKPVSYAGAINLGVEYAFATDADWCIVINNDVLCKGEFLAHAKLALRNDAIWGNKLYIDKEERRIWIDGWLWRISRKVWETVGYFDDNFKAAVFEDADYSFRCAEAGFEVRQSFLPFEHLAKSYRLSRPNFDANRKHNAELLKEKHGYDITERLSGGHTTSVEHQSKD